MTMFSRFLCAYDSWWRRQHGVKKFDELLSFSFEKYSGNAHSFADGSQILAGDHLAIIHFNRDCFDSPPDNPKQNANNAWRFRRLLLASFKKLANEMVINQEFSRVKAFYGVSWLPPHGEQLGFEIEKIPGSIVNSIRTFYFGVLLKHFFPQVYRKNSKRIEPYGYWLSRKTLLKKFSPERKIA
jgi:hypothetical protein